MRQPLAVDVRLDEKAFRSFAVFDILIYRRRWVRPAVFALIFSAFACVCFLLRARVEQAVLMGVVLLVIAAGLPLAYYGTFFDSVKKQARKMGLQTPQKVYTVTLDEHADEIRVQGSAGDPVSYPWQKLHAACRVSGFVYLYITPDNALILPDPAQGDADALWACVTRKLPAHKCLRRRGLRTVRASD